MLVVIYGTSGELIKLLPLLRKLNRDSYITICTYQQPQQLSQLYQKLRIPSPDIKIGQSEQAHDLERQISVPRWFIKVWWGFFGNRKFIKRLIKKSQQSSLVIVHGDTMTTVLGAVMGKFLRVPVAHIEAGLRSHNWRHPFPEEIDRVLTSKMATIHFTPDKTAVNNLKQAKAKGKIINTKYNTVLDSLRLAQKEPMKLGISIPKKFCVVSIHRNELLARPQDLQDLLISMKRFAHTHQIIFIDHPVTKNRLEKLGYNDLLKHPNIKRLPKLQYFDFIQLTSKADCIVTDSGGLQEESAYLGIPCLVHRMATERQEGLGSNVVLSYYDLEQVEAFFKDYNRLRSLGVAANVSPTKTILKNLRVLGFL
jgi:UDP-N-acetylglucosamine 2-epimerase (non-hydrolysing)